MLLLLLPPTINSHILIYSHVNVTCADAHNVCKEYLNFRHNRLPAMKCVILCTGSTASCAFRYEKWKKYHFLFRWLSFVLYQPTDKIISRHSVERANDKGHKNIIICRYVDPTGLKLSQFPRAHSSRRLSTGWGPLLWNWKQMPYCLNQKSKLKIRPCCFFQRQAGLTFFAFETSDGREIDLNLDTDILGYGGENGAPLSCLWRMLMVRKKRPISIRTRCHRHSALTAPNRATETNRYNLMKSRSLDRYMSLWIPPQTRRVKS